MSQPPYFIAGDWGTSNCRLYLCQYNQTRKSMVIDSCTGPGISQIDNNFEQIFFELADNWLSEYPISSVLLSGMIGSNIGWKEAPYLDCPVNALQIASGTSNFTARGLDFSILAGLKTINPLGLPDLMRGEELQILGWLNEFTGDQRQPLFALPGTHNKWACIKDGMISNFITAFSGELYALLKEQSILLRSTQDTNTNTSKINTEAFLRGVTEIKKAGESHLIHLFFSTRSQQVLGEMDSIEAADYLSGLIIGADVLAAARIFTTIEQVIIIAEPKLGAYYQICLNHLGIETELCEPSSIAVSGFKAVFEQLNNES